MLFSVLCVLIAVQVPSVPALSEGPPALSEGPPALSEGPPAPPRYVHVDNWLLTWPLTTEEGNVTFTVQYERLQSDVWTNVPACVHISLNSCNITSTKAEDKHGCVMLRVQAERRGLTSTSVEACSKHGHSCTPEIRLIVGPGSLTVHLNRNHSLVREYGDHAKHRVYYGKEGEPRQYADALASVTLRELQGGQRYCAEVQFLRFEKPFGPATCTQCVMLQSSENPKSQIVAAVLPVVFLLILIPVTAYFLIFQRERIKRWLQPPYHIPDDFFLEPFSENHFYSSSPTDEQYHVISSISQEEPGE
ncbi:interferon gamma receptor 2 [Anoplopoma fimbria]|uniref:interferon gamma receptor 2 n=1 Tax=Anoplopoma fimbria TaxID=229290 RepID=UPI0023EDB7F2|nr:interferon gamma receptor 2 [Anoplopoma fimbria]